jgi:hypothetical protein
VTRFVVDHEVLLRIAGGSIDVHPDHELVAPAIVRSLALAALYEAVRNEDIERKSALQRLDRVAEVKLRLLNDRVSRRRAFEVAEQLRLPDTRLAEFIAIVQLQADALVTLDLELERIARAVVRVEPVAALSRP